MTRPSTAAVATLGIDIGKNVFHLIGLNEGGAITLRQRLTRRQLEARVTNMPPCLVGMEACVGAHHLGRQLRALGHDVRLMAAKYVRPYSKGQKNDYRDAEAIAEGSSAPHDEVRRHQIGRAIRSAGTASRARTPRVPAHRHHQSDTGFSARAWQCACITTSLRSRLPTSSRVSPGACCTTAGTSR
jgi:transposase